MKKKKESQVIWLVKKTASWIWRELAGQLNTLHIQRRAGTFSIQTYFWLKTAADNNRKLPLWQKAPEDIPFFSYFLCISWDWPDMERKVTERKWKYLHAEVEKQQQQKNPPQNPTNQPKKKKPKPPKPNQTKTKKNFSSVFVFNHDSEGFFFMTVFHCTYWHHPESFGKQDFFCIPFLLGCTTK